MSAKPKLLTIQAMRGLAAMFIVLHHSFGELADTITTNYPFIVGVDVFFVISGFIMAYTSRERFGQAGAWKSFMLRRLIRIVPLYWFYTTLMVVVAFAIPQVLDTARLEWPHALQSYLFWPHESPGGDLQPLLALGWTLNYEMYFYAVFAAFLFLPLRKMLWAMTLFFAATVLAGTIISRELAPLYFWSRPIVLEFLFGAWIGYLVIKGVRLPEIMRYGGMALIVLMALALSFVHHLAAEQYRLALMGFAVFSVVLLALPRGAEEQGAPLWLKAMGDASYTIYLSHPFILGVITQLALLTGLINIFTPWGVFALCILGSAIGGYILYLGIEKPLLSGAKTVFLKGSDKNKSQP